MLTSAVFTAAVALVAWLVWDKTDPDPQPGDPTTAAIGVSPGLEPRTGQEDLTTAAVPLSAALRLRVLTEEDGRPLARVPVRLSFDGGEETQSIVMTDADGRCHLSLDRRGFRRLSALITAEMRVPKEVTWFYYELASQAEPQEYTLRLERGRTLDGYVRDELGQPVPRAVVVIRPSLDLTTREQNGTSSSETDLEGYWRSDQIPSGLDAVGAEVLHPDFALLTTNVSDLATTSIRPIFALERGLGLAGVVLDERGTPVPEALVSDEPRGGPRRGLQARTDHQGQFFFPHVLPGEIRLVARAGPHGMATNLIQLTEETAEVRLILGGQPEAGSPFEPTGPDRTILIAGTVLDAETAQPLEAFSVHLGEFVFDDVPLGRATFWVNSASEFLGSGRRGQFQWDWPPRTPTMRKFKLEVRASGYIPSVSRAIAADDKQHSLEFRLKRSAVLAGHLITPQGHNASGALLQLAGNEFEFTPVIECRPDQRIGLMVRPPRGLESQFVSEEDGRFSVQPIIGMDQLVILHSSGCRSLPLRELSQGPLRLRPWGRIEGTVRTGFQPGINCKVRIQSAWAKDRKSSFFFEGATRADDQGRFVFEQVPPGAYRLFLLAYLGGGESGRYLLSHNTGTQVSSGEVAQVNLGGTGRTVVGRLRGPWHDAALNWNSDFQTLTGKPPGESPKPDDFADQREFSRFLPCFLFQYPLHVETDGRFVAEDVLPGVYELRVRLTEPINPPPIEFAGPIPRREIASLNVQVQVLDGGPDDPPLDLGVVSLNSP